MALDIEEIKASINALTEEYYTITHNVANVSTTGYKRRRNEFINILADEQAAAESESTETTVSKGILDFSQGGLQQTDRPLDCALYGEGFFVVETPTGPLYTRSGVFHTNAQGQVVDLQGRLISGQGGPIVIPAGVGPSAIKVSEDGNISGGGAPVGKFRVVEFGENQSELVSVGGNCFQAPEGVVAQPAENIVVRQGYRESSNVSVMEELVKLITVTRLYQSNMKLLEVNQQSAGTIIGVAVG